MSEKRLTRREAIKKAAYITPVILTLAALPSFASTGSGNGGGHFDRHKKRTWSFLWWHGEKTKWVFRPDDS